jgi:protein-arginine kinase activator protein McsA
MRKAGIIIDLENENSTDDESGSMVETPGGGHESEFQHMSLDELEQLLQESIEKEDYEKASVIRDEIGKRKTSI